MSNIDNLKPQAAIIRDATEAEENTAYRVGSLIVDLIQAINDEIDVATNRINAIVGESASTAIDNFNEILKFLEGLKDTDSLSTIISNLNVLITGNTSAIATEVTNRKSADDALMGRIDAIVGENASTAIDNFNEILAFLNGVKDTESLTTLLEAIRQKIRIAEEIGKSAQKLASAAQDTANQAKSYGESALTGLGNEATNRKAEDAKLNAAIGELSNTLTERINVIIGENASSAIDNFNEILAFLNGVKDTESLTALLEGIKDSIAENETEIASLQNLHQNLLFNAKNGINIHTLEPGMYNLTAKRVGPTDPIYPVGTVATLIITNISKSEADPFKYKGAMLSGYASISNAGLIIPNVEYNVYKYANKWVKVNINNDQPLTGVLHRRCISINSLPEEVYSGYGMRFPLTQKKYDISAIRHMLPHSDGTYTNEYAVTYTLSQTELIIDSYDRGFLQAALILNLNKQNNEFVKFSKNRKLIVGYFPVTKRVFSADILPAEIKLYYGSGSDKFGYNLNRAIRNNNPTLEVEIWKPVRRYGTRTHPIIIMRKEWVKVSTHGTAVSSYNSRVYDYLRFLIRARRVNSKKNVYGEWQKFDVRIIMREDATTFFKISKSNAEYRKSHIANRQLLTQNYHPALQNALGTYSGGINLLSATTDNLIAALKQSFPTSGDLIFTTDGRVAGYCINGNCIETSSSFVYNKIDSIIDRLSLTVEDYVTLPDITGIAFNPITEIISLPDLSLTKKLSFLFAGCSIVRTIPPINTSSCHTFSNFMNGCNSMYSIPLLDFTKATTAFNAFNSMHNLTHVEGFTNLAISIVLLNSPLLTPLSIMNIITQAKNLAEIGARAQTLSLGKDNLNKLTTEQKAVAVAKGWTLA